ncbi:MAG TPA: hypothetical protein EYG88_00350 [Desulfocapsa sulfexigens]|nr:hypothetical protein [Desulfocapsa sulfexigens]
MSISPKDFGLPPRTVLEQLDEQTIAIIIDRKSRIIMADGKKIIEKAQKITATLPSVAVVLKTSAPVCSKTTKLLESNGIELISRT